MTIMFPKLFEPGKMGQLELKNRIIKAPMVISMATPDGLVTDRLIRHYEEQARGGASLLIVEATHVDNKSSHACAFQLGAYDNKCIPGLSSLTQAIHNNGAKAALQISHSGILRILGAPFLSGPAKVPSPVPEDDSLFPLFRAHGMVPKALTFEEIQEIITAFSDAAKRAQAAGFDMVEIHGAHGYLILNFLSQ